MPINMGNFFIRKPRVSQYNAPSTKPPTSQGSYILKQCFSVAYSCTGTSSALLSITGEKFQTIINESIEHSDNLNIDVIGRSVQELVNVINENSNYTAKILTNDMDDLCLLEGTTKTNINNSTHTIFYNLEKEYLIDTAKEGKLNDCTISYKEKDFTYSGENNRWMLDEGYIYDEMDVPLEVNGSTFLGNSGVQIKFFSAIDNNDNDINSKVIFENLELARSLDTPLSETIFSAAPILIDKTLTLKINQEIKEEGKDYLIDYGIPAELKTINASPYTFDNSNNIFRIRHNSTPMQEFVFPIGLVTVAELVSIVNQESNNFKAYSFLDEETKLEYFSIKANRGTSYHQLKIEDGTANSVLGYTSQLAAKGESNGKLLFMTHIPSENITPLEKTNNLKVSAVDTIVDNPFLGISINNFKLQEKGEELKKDKDFLISESGEIQLTSEVKKEKLLSGILTEDSTLFPESYNVYDNGNKLLVGIDYKINTQGGWITLMTSAFPGHVYTVDYRHVTAGIIKGEVLLGTQAEIFSSVIAPYTIPFDQNTLKISINNDDAQFFNLPLGNNITLEDTISSINTSATGFDAYPSKDNVLAFRTVAYGPKATLTILDGSSNYILGFDDFTSAAGSGAIGGEQALQTTLTPMEIGGFTAPEGGDTIIIKDNDITDRYSSGTIIKLQNDFYQIKDTYLETRANLINTISEPYILIENSNNTLRFTIDNNEETEVLLKTGKEINVDLIVDQIIKVHPNSAKTMFVNGIKRIQLLGNTLVRIGDGNANRTLGFESNKVDTNTPDTFLFTTNLFKTIYVNPTMYTTVDPVVFVDDESSKRESPQNTNEIFLMGDISSIYQDNIVIRLDNKYFYTVKNSSYDKINDVTAITLTSKIDIPFYKDTKITYTENPILLENNVKLKTKHLPVLSEPFNLYKNNNLLIFEKDYEISDMGDIELTSGLKKGDQLDINYLGKRYIDAGTSVIADYTYFDYLKIGSNIKINYEAIFPDNFYLRVIHASTLMENLKKEVMDKIQQTANSSSSGFPTGVIPVATNAESGSSSFEYDLGDLDNKITLTQLWYNYFNNRIEYFENEKCLLKGFKVGAEDGKLTQAQIEDSVNNPPTRLFPLPDTRAEEEKSEPTKLPSLFGENKNDAGSDALGWYSDNILKRLNDEVTKSNDEKTKLNQLLIKSITSGSTYSTGNFDIYGSEQMQLYIEKNITGSLVQTNHTITFTEKFTVFPINHRPNTAAEIASDINSQAGLVIASHSGSIVYLNATLPTPCVYVVADAPSVGFGNDSDASVRSRSPWWTGGYTYSLLVPGNYSVHLDISEQNTTRTENQNKHEDQIINLNGIMDEWLPPFDVAFNPAKTERDNAQNWINPANEYTSKSNSFDNLKSISNGEIFSSLDNPTVINSRLTEINSRLTIINNRISEINIRYSLINTLLQNENLFNQRYSWLSLLVHRSNGYYSNRKRTINIQNQKIREAENNSVALNSMDSFG